MKILVLGIPKTGTTYTYYLLKKSLPNDYDIFLSLYIMVIGMKKSQNVTKHW